MAFRPLNWEEGRVVQLAAAATITFVKGNAVVDDTNGFYTNAAAGEQGDIQYIAAESVTTRASTGQLVSLYRVDPSVRISADCAAAPAQTAMGTTVDLGAAGNVDTTASDDDVFFLESIDLAGGAVGTSTVVTGYFTQAVPNS